MHTLGLATNYTVSRATDEVIARIMMYVFGGTVSQYLHHGKIKDTEQQRVVAALQQYEGPLQKYVHTWKGHNIVPSVLRNEFATLIAGTTVTPTFKANYIALGDDNTTPANTDTLLGNETLRGLFTNRSSVNNIAYLDKFFSSAEVGGNSYLELGVFVDGTGTVDTGYLLSRILINESLGVNETLTINATFTIS